LGQKVARSVVGELKVKALAGALKHDAIKPLVVLKAPDLVKAQALHIHSLRASDISYRAGDANMLSHACGKTWRRGLT